MQIESTRSIDVLPLTRLNRKIVGDRAPTIVLRKRIRTFGKTPAPRLNFSSYRYSSDRETYRPEVRKPDRY